MKRPARIVRVATRVDEQIPILCGKALRRAYRRALAHQGGVFVSGDLPDGGRAVFEVFADGRRRVVKSLPPALSVPVGTRVRIP
jgi:hypothetical protein